MDEYNGIFTMYDNESGDVIPALNTYVVQDYSQPGAYSTPPFDHASRLADKLFGGVEMALDQVLRKQQLQNDMDIYKQVGGQYSILPPQATAFVQRNTGVIMTFMVLFAIFFLGSRLAR